LPERAESVTGIPLVEMTEELEENIRHRGRAYVNKKNSMIIQKEDDDSDDLINSNGSGERSTSLYCRSIDDVSVNLEDF
jgi:hypothetical protein